MTFTEDVQIVDGEQGVHFTFSREGRPSGECFVELIDEDNVQRGLKCHNKHMGNRYIEGSYWKCVPGSLSKFSMEDVCLTLIPLLFYLLSFPLQEK